MRIVLVQPWMDFIGGSMVTGYDECQEWCRQGHEVTLITTRYNHSFYPDPLFDIVEVGYRSFVNNSLGWFFPEREFSLLSVLDRVRRAVKKASADAVMTKLFPSNWINGDNIHFYCDEPSFALYGSRVNPVEGSVNPKAGFYFDWLRKTLRFVDKKLTSRLSNPILANGNRTKHLVEDIYGLNSKIILPGIPLERYDNIKFNADFIRDEYGVNPDFINFLFISRLNSHKNCILALKAFKLLSKLRKDVKLFIAGSGPREDYLRKYAKHYDLNVCFTGGIPHSHKIGLFSVCDIVLFPPLFEPFGLVPLEAMTFKKPVIGINEWGAAESIVHKKTGFLVNNDEQEFMNAMLHLSNDKKLREKMGLAGRKRVEKEFTIQRMAKELVNKFNHT